MLECWLGISGAILLFSLVLAWAAFADCEERRSAWYVVAAMLCWTWPVVVPLAIIFGLINLVFFTLEELLDIDRPKWWPTQS